VAITKTYVLTAPTWWRLKTLVNRLKKQNPGSTFFWGMSSGILETSTTRYYCLATSLPDIDQKLRGLSLDGWIFDAKSGVPAHLTMMISQRLKPGATRSGLK
jgi:hypothetical protein